MKLHKFILCVLVAAKFERLREAPLGFGAVLFGQVAFHVAKLVDDTSLNQHFRAVAAFKRRLNTLAAVDDKKRPLGQHEASAFEV